jgi:hypothetical protein
VRTGGEEPQKGEALSRERKPLPRPSNTPECSATDDLREVRVAKHGRRRDESRAIAAGRETLERRKLRRASAGHGE